MLVDDATVEVENIHRNHTQGKPLITEILEGASQIATPTLVGTLSICIVFFPVVLLRGVGRYCLRRSPWPWSLRCSPLTCFREPWSRLWR